MLSIYKPAEKCSYCSTKKANMFKARRLIEKEDTAISTRCSGHLSRQFLNTASTFPYSSKNSSAEHSHALSTCLILTNTLTHIVKHTYSMNHSLTNTHTYTHTHTHTHTQTHGNKHTLTRSRTQGHV